MPLTATLINLYHVCHRELRLHDHGIRMESNSETVAEGSFIKIIRHATWNSMHIS